MSCLLSGENESRKSAITGKLALFFQVQASSDPVSLQSDASIAITRSQKNTRFPFNAFYVNGQLENAVVKLTWRL